MRNILLSFLMIFSIYDFDTFAQKKNLSILTKLGQSNYRIPSWSENSHSIWNNGLQLSAGIEKQLGPKSSLQGLFVYSIHGFDERYSWGEKVNNAKNNVYDLMGNLKLSIGIFYFIGGAGISYQNSDAVKYLESNQYHNATTLYAAKERFGIAGLLGLGLDIIISEQINLITEADINMREYVGTSLLVGLKYSLPRSE